jgi:hypothetical protein
VSFLSRLCKRFASPFRFRSLGDVKQLTNSLYPIGVFKQSGTSVPKYSNPICQLTLHCTVAGCQTPTCGCQMLAGILSQTSRYLGCWTGLPRSKHNATIAQRKIPHVRNITLQCNVIFFIDSNLPHCPKDANRNNNDINN